MKSNLTIFILSFLILLINCKSENFSKNMKEVKENKISVDVLWSNYINENLENKNTETPISFYFCENKIDADDCAELVLKGIKRATATSLWWFEKK